ncbi:MAG: Hsp20 family protein [Alphaproteobacteria bacterium]|nr:Hsp20 family protein [Alphaproteobacteria bacterium]
MTTPPLFNSPLLLGFEDLERVLDRVSKASSDGYPPYNIEQVDGDRLRITLAVAGFKRGDLSVTVEDNQLVVRGRRAEDEAPRTYLHRGIAARQFQRAFVLADGIEIAGAELADGLLSIDLRRPRPTESVRRVDIMDGEARAEGARKGNGAALAIDTGRGGK